MKRQEVTVCREEAQRAGVWLKEGNVDWSWMRFSLVADEWWHRTDRVLNRLFGNRLWPLEEHGGPVKVSLPKMERVARQKPFDFWSFLRH